MKWIAAAVVALVLALSPLPATAAEPPAAPRPPEEVLSDIRDLKAQLAHLTEHMPEGTGLSRRIAHRRVERVWTRIAQAAHLMARDLSALSPAADERNVYRDDLVELLREIDAAVRAADERLGTDLANLSPDESALAPAELASIYYERSQILARRIDLLRAQTQNLSWMETFGMSAATVATTRQWLATASTETAEVLSLSLEVANDDVQRLNAQVRRLPDNADLKSLRAVVESRIESLAANLHDVVDVMEDQNLHVAAYREQIVLSTHQISDDLLDTELLGYLTSSALGYVQRWVTSTGPQLLVKALVMAFILFVSWTLARALGRLAERAMASRRFTASRLLRDLVSRSSRRVVMIFGILVALSQVGVSIGPLLAGLGVAGFVIGFAMQDSLSNFASGVLILIYRPFDVGDTVEAGEVFGMVRDMSLVNTTILTFDNQTLVVPNTKIWSGVIRNVTAQTNRRVDLTFDVSYDDDMAEVERILLDVVRGHDKVLGEPEPVVKLHELSDSAVKFVVRPWVRRDDYWDVYWDLTRAVKMRFDEAGISIPFPHRQVVVKGLESLLRERDAAALADGRGTGSS